MSQTLIGYRVIYMEVVYAGVASLHGCNLLEQRRSSCRGAKNGQARYDESYMTAFS
ncbi:MAG: hypothetical protein ACJA2B_001527 [Candidatus Endobugula sp.]|jgi:hypothetical protein